MPSGEIERLPIAYISITESRVGSGESVVSVVDLPVYRDYAGFILLNGEAIKGAFRNKVYLTYSPKLADLLFGRSEVSEYVGPIGVEDASLIFIPVITDSFRYIYLTCPELINRVVMILNNTRFSKIKSWLSSLADRANKRLGLSDLWIYLPELEKEKSDHDVSWRSWIEVAGEFLLKATFIRDLGYLWNLVEKVLESVSIKSVSLKNIATLMIGGLGIVSNFTFKVILEKALIIKPSVKLKGMQNGIYQKIVETGPWFEEEVPKFSIFIGACTITRPRIPRTIVKDILPEVLKDVEELNIQSEDDYIKFDLGVARNAISKILRCIYIGAKETANKGLFTIINLDEKLSELEETIKNEFKAEVETKALRKVQLEIKNPLDKAIDIYKRLKNEKKKKEKEKGKKESLELRADVLKKWIEDIHGKLSALPERVKQLGLIHAYLFYTIIKASSEGKGYEEVRSAINTFKELLEHYYNCLRRRDEGKELSDEDEKEIVRFISNYSQLLSVLTHLKYIIQAYRIRGEQL